MRWCDRWCDHEPRTDVEHRRDIQRTYGNPEPDRSILIIRCGCEAGEGVFRGRGENEVVT